MHVRSTAWLVDLLLPSRCTACGAPAPLLCDECRSQLRLLTSTCCAYCGAPTAWPVERCRECSGRRLAFASARGAVAYAGPARALVRGWKERGLHRVASLAADLVHATLGPVTADAITYIPADARRQLKRGAHPAETLARELGRRWDVTQTCLLRRTRVIPRQTQLTFAERRRNVAGAFASAGAAPRHVLLVDDVYTTGATASAAARELLRAGAERVDVVTFARAIRA